MICWRRYIFNTKYTKEIQHKDTKEILKTNLCALCVKKKSKNYYSAGGSKVGFFSSRGFIPKL